MSILDSFQKLSFADLVDTAVSWRPTRRGTFKFFLYLIYGVVVFTVVWCAKFYVRQADTLAREAVAGLEGISVEFPYLEPHLFPPRVTLDYLRVANAKTKKTTFEMRDTDIRLSLFPLVVGKVSFSIKSRMYGGIVEADVSSGALLDFDWISCDLKADMFELERIPQVNVYDRTLKGFGSIDTEIKGVWSAPASMSGDLYLNLAQLNMENRFPVVKGRRLKGYQLDLDCSLEDGLMTVRDLDILSNDGISLKTEGAVTLSGESFEKSTLDMTGKFIGPPNRLATSMIDKKAVVMLKRKQAVKVELVGKIVSPRLQMVD